MPYSHLLPQDSPPGRLPYSSRMVSAPVPPAAVPRFPSGVGFRARAASYDIFIRSHKHNIKNYINIIMDQIYHEPGVSARELHNPTNTSLPHTGGCPNLFFIISM